jgi:hypothetical protein
MATNTLTYSIDGMRVVEPQGRTAEKNPDRFLTVLGSAFYPVDEKGKRGEKLSITSKNIDKADVTAEGFAIDLKAGTLTLPTAQRGRKASEGLSADELAAKLAAL